MEGLVEAEVVIDWFRRVRRDLRRACRGRLRGVKEQKKHTLGVGAELTLRNEVLRVGKGRRLSRGGIVCREECGMKEGC